MTEAITVIIPTRDRPELLREAVGSVLAQTHRPIDVVVVDDGSTVPVDLSWVEGSAGVPIRVIRHDDARGRNAARNAGLAETSAPFVAFLDDDDRLTSDALATLVGHLGSRPGAVAVACGRSYFGSASGVQPWPRRVLCRDVFWDALYGVALGGVGVLYRTAVLREVGGLAEGHEVGEDWLSGIRVSAQGPYVICPDRLLEVRIRQEDRWHERAAEITRVVAAVEVEAQRWAVGHRQARIRRALRARRHLHAGLRAFQAGAPLRGVGHLAAGVAIDPNALCSRLYWASHGGNLARALVPRRVKDRAKRWRGEGVRRT